MAKNEEQAFLNLKITVDKGNINKDLNDLSDKIASGLASSLSKAVDGFAKKLGSSIQVAFDDTVIGTLKKPIKITLDTKDAQTKVNNLVEPLRKAITQLNKATGATGSGGGSSKTTTTPLTLKEQTVIRENPKQLTAQIRAQAKALGVEIENEINSKLKPISDSLKGILYPKKGALLPDSEIKKLEKVLKELQSIQNIVTRMSTVKSGNIVGDLTNNLEKAQEGLKRFGLTEEQIATASKKVQGGINSLKEQLNLLADTDPSNLKEIDRILKSIEKTQSLAASRINTLATNRGGVVNPNLTNLNAQRKANLSGIAGNIPREIDLVTQLEKKLDDVRKKIAAPVSKGGFDVPLVDVTRKTSSFESALINARVQLKRLDDQLKAGELTEAQAANKFKAINETLAKTKIAIEQINAKAIGDAFKSDQIDRFSKSMSTNLAVLGFTLQRVGNQLNNFGQQTLQVFSKLATAAQPIEQAENIIQKNFVETGKITREQSKILLKDLKDLADLPGNNLKDTTQSFLRLSDALGDLGLAYNATKGLIKLSANTGIDKGREITDILLSARERDEGFDPRGFARIRSLGGKNIQEALDKAGLTTTSKANKAGADEVIKVIAKELSNLGPTALTTADRFNVLANRVAELGKSIGQILSPALNNLNEILERNIIPLVNNLKDRFDALPESTKSIVSNIALGIPVFALLTGALISLGGALAFAASGFLQLINLSKSAKNAFSVRFGKPAVDVVEEVAPVVNNAINPNLASRFAAKKTGIPNVPVAETGKSISDLFAKGAPSVEKMTNELKLLKKELSIDNKLKDIAKFSGNTEEVSKYAKGISKLESQISRLTARIIAVPEALDAAFVGKGLSSLSNFRKFIEEFFQTLIKGIKSLPGLIGSGFTNTFKTVTGVFTSGKGAVAEFFNTIRAGVKEFGFFKSLLGGSVSAITGISKGLSGIAGGLKTVLLGTGPIGIAINVILSVFTALYDNFNGIRDRSKATFAELFRALDKFGDALGYNGILGLLKRVGDFFNVVFGFIGEVILDVINALAGAMTDLINNMTNIVTFFRNGQILSGIWETIKFFWNAFASFGKRIIIEIVATLADAVAAIFEKSIGKGAISGGFRDAADDLRSFTGTDKASVARQKIIDSEKELQKEQQKTIDQQKDADEARLKRIEDLKKSLEELQEKAKEDFIKFRFDQLIDNLKTISDTIKDNTATEIESFKNLISATTDLNTISNAYANTLSVVQSNQKELINNQSRLSFSEGLREFRSATSASQEGFKQIYELAAKGEASYKGLADAITNASNANNLGQLRSSLTEVANLAQGLNLTTVINTVEKTRAAIESTTRQTQSTIRDYRKQIKDLRDLNIERKFVVEAELRNIELEAKNRKREQESRLQEIRDRAEVVRAEREGTTEQNKATEERLAEIRKLSKEQEKEREDLEEKRKNIAEDFRKEQQKGNLPITAIVEDDINYKDITGKLNSLQEKYNKLNEEERKLFSQESLSRADRFFTAIGDKISEINGSLSNMGDSLSKSIARISLLFKNAFTDTFEYTGFTPEDPSVVSILSTELDRLINVTKELPASSKYVKEFYKIIEDLKLGSISGAEALQKFINTLSKAQIEPISKENRKSQDLFKKLVESSKKKGNFTGSIVIPSEVKSERDVNDVLSQLVGVTPISDNKNRKKSLIDIKQDSLSEEVYILKEKLVTQLGEYGDKDINTTISLIKELISTAENSSEEELKIVLNALFNNPEIANFSATAAQIYSAALAAYEANNKETQAKLKADIDNKVKLIEGRSTVELEKLDIDIQSQEELLTDLQQRIRSASGSERERLLREQGEILVKLADFKYKRLDIEETYNIQKAIVQAAGNKAEIEQIEKDGLLRRQKLQKQRNLEIQDFINSGQANVNKKGQVVGADGKPIQFSGLTEPVKIEGDTSEKHTRTTEPAPDIIGADSTGRIANSAAIIKNSLDGIANSAREAGNAILDMYNRLASGEGIINTFVDLIGGMKLNMETLGEAFINVAEFAIAAFGQALGQAITETLLNGGNFLKNLKKFFGDILISMGTQLISMGAIATAIGLLALIPFFSFLDPDHKSLIFGPIAIAAGIAAVLAGKALGGGGASASASNTNATNSANSSAGNSGQVEYDPNKDPKLIYQKGLLTQVLIDIKQDEGSIVKTFIKHSTRDPRLGNIIGNTNRTNYAL